MLDTLEQIAPHHREAARMWSCGGAAYNNVSFAISDALAHTAQRLNPQAGEAILDVATGTGWSARNVARAGARVTGVDIAPDLLDAAQTLSAHVDPPIAFQLADAERLPFEDGTFDGLISTFGVMFALDHERVAMEMARVCRPGGRLALATWTPDSAVAEFFAMIARYSDAPPPPNSPLAWGNPEHVTALLGSTFDLTFERGTNNAYHDSEAGVWDWYARGFGPMCQLIESLDPERRAALRADVDAYHAHYRVEAGLHIKRDYLVVLGTRR